MDPEVKNELEGLLKRLQTAIQEMVTLKITTTVGRVEQNDNGATVNNGKTIFTKIDLAQGDVVTMLDEAFLAADMAELRQHHLDRENQAHEIVEKNVEVVKSLINFVKELLEEEEAPGA